MRSDCHENGFVAIFAETVQREVNTGLQPVPDFNTERLEDRDVLVDDGLREPVGGYCPTDHPPGIRVGFEDRHAESGVSEFLAGGQAGRSGADDGYLLAGSRFAGEQHRLFLVLHDEPLHVPDGQRLVEVGTDAGVLAKVITDSPQDRRERVVLPGQTNGLEEVAVAHRVHVVRHLLVDGALVEAWCFDAVEVLEVARGLGTIRPERLFPVTPIRSHFVGVVAEIQPGEHSADQPDEGLRAIEIAPRLESPGADDFNGRAVDRLRTESIGQSATRVEVEVEAAIGEGGVMEQRGELVEVGVPQGGLGNEISQIHGADIVDRLLEVLDVLQHSKITARLEEVRTHGDGLHSGLEQAGDVERIRSTGE